MAPVVLQGFGFVEPAAPPMLGPWMRTKFVPSSLPVTVCGVTPAGVGYCWGYNASGGVGDGTLEHRPVPTLVAGGLTFKSISAGTGISCGITTASAAYCWGDNSNGDLGDGTTISRPTPGPVRF